MHQNAFGDNRHQITTDYINDTKQQTTNHASQSNISKYGGGLVCCYTPDGIKYDNFNGSRTKKDK